MKLTARDVLVKIVGKIQIMPLQSKEQPIWDIAAVDSPEEKSRICLSVLRALPEWFGVESAIQGYTSSVRPLPFFVARKDGRDVGFLSLKQNTACTMEIHVMGVLKECHRRGIGTVLLAQAERHGQENGMEFLTVKTLDESVPCDSYEKTRQFYRQAGFKPLEVFPLFWNAENPCLFLVKQIAGPNSMPRGTGGT